MCRFCCILRHCRFYFDISAFFRCNFSVDVRTASGEHMRPAHDMATACQPKLRVPFDVACLTHPCRSNRKETDTAVGNQVFSIAASRRRRLTLSSNRRRGRNHERRHDRWDPIGEVSGRGGSLFLVDRELPAGRRDKKRLVAAY